MESSDPLGLDALHDAPLGGAIDALDAALAEGDGRHDAAVVEALSRSRRPDALLAEIDLAGLARLVERCARRAVGDERERPIAVELAGLVSRSSLTTRIDRSDVPTWSERVLALVEAAHYTVGVMFRQRAERLGSKTLFEEHGTPGRALSWRNAAGRIDLIARGLLASADDGEPGPVAILSENRLEVALVDLACLGSGIVNVMVPANATAVDVAYILRHARVRTVIAQDPSQWAKVPPAAELPELRQGVLLEGADRVPGVRSLKALIADADRIDRSVPAARGRAARIDDLATVMYTSGTTGTPKGIRFSQRNIVFKRFARGLALPEIGEDDVFLCFLPLYHTFGRFLEMLGAVFWGAKYCFLGRTSADSLIAGMQAIRPTVFISVPRKWLQLYERISSIADPLETDDAAQRQALERLTGARLRFGLSAAGHLDAEIFRFFQRHGVELMSGFGMTEATGGITMTPPGEYADGSLGIPLPGIDVRLADDGEMLVRGPYVMMGYLDPEGGGNGYDDAGWFPTGDLMDRDERGHFRLIDRKKEIYKNVKGETIAPQRIENSFRDFESVGRAFLVGDHREYNTLLVYPDPTCREPDFAEISREEVHDHFRSLVGSVNKFLAPYERIVDFAILDRDLDPEREELTPKGTPRRKTVEKNFRDVVEPLYRRTDIRVSGIDLTLPNWFFQASGLTARDIRREDDALALPSRGTRLTIHRVGDDCVRVGSCVYRYEGDAVNLGALMTTPRLWLGNRELVEFCSLDAAARVRNDRTASSIEWLSDAEPHVPTADERRRLGEWQREPEGVTATDLDVPARLLGGEELDALCAIAVLEAVVGEEDHPAAETAKLLLSRLARAKSATVRRTAFLVLLPAARPARFTATLDAFLEADPEILDRETRQRLSEGDLSEPKLEGFLEVTRRICWDETVRVELAGSLLAFLAEFGAAHPVRYRRLRAFLERASLFASHEEVRASAADAQRHLREGFRQWLGATARIAVDPETGREYRWEDVVVFEEDGSDQDRRRILSAIKNTVFLKEGVFLFSTGSIIRLSDIPPGGVWIRCIGRRHGKTVYRITIQTRFQGSYDLAVNVNQELAAELVRDELRLMILAGDATERGPLVEDFGGYWPDQDLWSEEFIAGETLKRSMRRLSRSNPDRLEELWPFFAWSTLSAYVDFWHRSGGRFEIGDADLTNIVVPTEDYQSGVRLVSLSRRRQHDGLLAMLERFLDYFLAPTEKAYPQLAGRVTAEVAFSALIEVLGEAEGTARLRSGLAQDGSGPLADRLREWLGRIDSRGYVPMRLHFAIERYRRWSGLSADATQEARALTLNELFDTYRLERLAESYPEVRLRFFRETVFRSCAEALGEGLDNAIARIRDRSLPLEDLIHTVDELRAQLEPDPETEYFLARLSYPYLRPEDAARFVRSQQGGRRTSEIVVNLEDHDGNTYRVRHALNPKEVERLHRLFLAAKLEVRFRMEHQYLVAINERLQIIGGIFYEIDEDGLSAHLEKIVVADAYRRRGVADGLMKEFFNRLRVSGVETVTTGFFRPEYFYRFGFRIEKRYAGLVRSLVGEDVEPG